MRYDGRGARDPLVAEELAELLELIAVCPEVEAGLGVPRPTIDLHEQGVVETVSRIDRTTQLRGGARAARLAAGPVDGFIVKSRSPSCGLAGVKVFHDGSPHPTRDGVGLFVRELQAAYPALAVVEEGHLRDPALREEFLSRVFARARARVY